MNYILENSNIINNNNEIINKHIFNKDYFHALKLLEKNLNNINNLKRLVKKNNIYDNFNNNILRIENIFYNKYKEVNDIILQNKKK